MHGIVGFLYFLMKKFEPYTGFLGLHSFTNLESQVGWASIKKLVGSTVGLAKTDFVTDGRIWNDSRYNQLTSWI